jgi:hypothetical protein
VYSKVAFHDFTIGLASGHAISSRRPRTVLGERILAARAAYLNAGGEPLSQEAVLALIARQRDEGTAPGC